MRIGVGKTYGRLVGSSNSLVGSGVTRGMVGINVGVRVVVDVTDAGGVALGNNVSVGVGSSVAVSSTKGAGAGSVAR